LSVQPVALVKAAVNSSDSPNESWLTSRTSVTAPHRGAAVLDGLLTWDAVAVPDVVAGAVAVVVELSEQAESDAVRATARTAPGIAKRFLRKGSLRTGLLRNGTRTRGWANGILTSPPGSGGAVDPSKVDG